MDTDDHFSRRGVYHHPHRVLSGEVLSGTAWLLLPLSVLPLLLYYFVHHDDTNVLRLYYAYGMVATWGLGALSLPYTRYLGRLLVSISLIGTLFSSGHQLLENAVLFLVILFLGILILARLWMFHNLRLMTMHYAEASSATRAARNARLAALGALVVGFINWGGNAPEGHVVHAATFAASGFASVGLVLCMLRMARHYIWRTLLLVLVVMSTFVALIAGSFDMRTQALITLMAPLMGILVIPRTPPVNGGRIDWWEPLLHEPSRIFVTTFVLLSFIGAFALLLPISTRPGVQLSFIDALFMSVSAVCVTGLATVTPHYEFTTVGQLIFGLLIQLGGLGVMTFSLVAFGFLGGRVSLRVESMMAGFLSEGDRRTIRRALFTILAYTLIVESMASVILILRYWLDGLPPLRAIGHGIFAAISAFNNAGHTLTSDNLHPFMMDPIVLLTISSTIILGGTTPFMLLALRKWRQRGRIGIGYKLALQTTAALLLIGCVGFIVLEWHQSLEGLPVLHKLTNGFFQSASVRTAGFTTVDLAETQPATKVMFMVLMAIGGNPGGTAGGIKTTTIAVLVLGVVAALRGRRQVQVGYRVLPHTVVYQATATATVMVAVILGFSMLMMLTQSISPLQSLFEVVSALSTTGHSLNASAELDTVGKSIIILCMLIGRVGMLTFFMFLSSHETPTGWNMAEEDINLG